MIRVTCRTHSGSVGGRGGWGVKHKGWGVVEPGKGGEHRARDMLWSPALPIGTALEGGDGGELDAGGGRR